MNGLALAAEDLALGAWNAAGVPLVALSSAAPVLALADAPDAFAGWCQLLAVIAAIVAIATRPAGAPLADAGVPRNEARWALVGPFIFAISFVTGSASTYLGMDLEGPVVGIAFLIIFAAFMLADRLPTIDPRLRRVLLLPFVMVCAGIFDGFAAQLIGDVDLGALIASLSVDQTGFAAFVLTMLLSALAVFYTGLVVAPRVVAAPETHVGWFVWPARFALFVVSAALGITWLAAATG